MTPFKKYLIGISYKEASFEKREFEIGDPATRKALEKVIRVFIDGYHLAIETPNMGTLVKKIEKKFDSHHQGFAFEGVGMYYAIRDLLWMGKCSRLNNFCQGKGASHDYIIGVGAGFAIARVPWGSKNTIRYMRRQDRRVAWCIPDGFGYHQGFFQHKKYIEKCADPPERLSPSLHQLFNSGVGRAMWWVKCGSPVAITKAIARFPEERQAELWAGIGVASAYAGGVPRNTMTELLTKSGIYRGDFLSGIPFAARLRQKGGNHSEWTDFCCEHLLGLNTEKAANFIVDQWDLVQEDFKRSPKWPLDAGYGLVRILLRDEFHTLDPPLNTTRA